MVAREIAPCRARNCSTACCGFCSSADELTSAYELKHRTMLSAAEASCMASTAAICAASLYFRSSFPSLTSDGGSVVHEALASVSFLLLAATFTRLVTFGLFKTPDVLLIGEESLLFTTLSESSAGALAELFLGGVRILLSSLFDGFSSANDFRLGVEELRFSDFFSALAGFESELPLSFASAFPSQLLLKALGPDSKLNKVLLMELPREDFLPAVVAFNTDAAFSSKDSLDGGDFSAPLVLTLCFMSLENLSNDAGREWALVGEDGVDLALVDFAFELTTSFLSERRPLSACFERLEFDLVSWGFLLSVPLLLGGALIFSNLPCSFSSDRAPASLELPLVEEAWAALPLPRRKVEELVTTRSSGLPTQAWRPGTGLTPLRIGTGVAASRRSTWTNCPSWMTSLRMRSCCSSGSDT
uniref:Uncharacterized protein n=1 Tax=Zea mays TaxID=4577 RepID=C4IYD3_MAIZE|nr:unknown [Zea mays]ACR36317.1 unknown [Zea mays]